MEPGQPEEARRGATRHGISSSLKAESAAGRLQPPGPPEVILRTPEKEDGQRPAAGRQRGAKEALCPLPRAALVTSGGQQKARTFKGERLEQVRTWRGDEDKIPENNPCAEGLILFWPHISTSNNLFKQSGVVFCFSIRAINLFTEKNKKNQESKNGNKILSLECFKEHFRSHPVILMHCRR